MVVREPSGTEVGTAQIFASGGITGPVGAVVVAAVVVATGLGAVGRGEVTVFTTVIVFG